MMRREKSGVAGIIAGIFLAAILFSSVFVFFLAITEGQTTRTKAEIEAQGYKNERLQEVFRVRSEDNLAELDANNQGYIKIWVNNTGGIPMTVSYVMVYNQNDVPMLEGTPFIFGSPFTINGGFDAVINTKDINSSVRFDKDPVKPYRIDIISERGNIQSTTYPPPPLIEIDLEITSPFAQEAAEAALAQQTGSILLNYTAFGAIFPDFPTSTDGVVQSGWKAKIKDVPGYPAFRLIDAERTYLTTLVKNKDFSGEDMTVLHYTAFILTQDSGSSFSQKVVYICDTNYSTGEVAQYQDSSGPNSPVHLINEKTYPPPPPKWEKLTFCDTNISTGTFWNTGGQAFKPGASNVNFLFMIIRGDFDNGQPYAQTIPYQAALIPSGTISASLKIQGTENDKYTSTAGSEDDVDVNTSGATLPVDIHWVYQDGTYTKLGTITTGSSMNVNIPTRMPDPANSSCNVAANPHDPDCPIIAAGFYIIQITDNNERVYYRTFELTGGE